MKLTPRRIEIMRGIARGGILFQAGWMNSCRARWRGRDKAHCSFYRASAANGGHRRVSAGLAEKMEACGLIERFKPARRSPVLPIDEGGIRGIVGKWRHRQWVNTP